MSQAYEPPVDPFADAEKAPALSFKDMPTGTKYVGTVTSPPKLLQERDYDTGGPAWWDKAQTQPKMAVVINLTVAGELRSVWAPKPSAMYRALAEAQKEAGTLIAEGGVLTVELIGEKANPDKPRLAPQKLYRASFSSGDAFADSDSEEPPF